MTRNLSWLIIPIFTALFLGQTARAQNVVAKSGSPSPSLVFLGGDPTYTALSASDTAPPTPPVECSLGSPTWSWAITLVQYSADGSSYGSPTTDDYSAIISQDNSYCAKATLEADFGAGGAGVGGYYQFTCQATVQYQDSCGGKWPGSDTTTATDTALAVTIERQPDGGNGYAPIGPGNQNVLPGEYVDLKAVLAPAVPATFLWNIDPTNFQNYNMATGTLTPLAGAFLANQTVQFSWTDPGAKNVTCTVTAGGGQAKNFNATLTVLPLTINPAYTTALGWPQINAAGNKLGLYAAFGLAPGIIFTAGINVPPLFAPGQWAYLQTVISARHQTLNGGTKQHWSLNGLVELDTLSPYDGPYGTGAAAQSADDSPNNSLDATITNSSVTNDQFNMYIMFMPAGGNSQWVPVQSVGWSWSGAATRGAGGVWTLDAGSGAQNANAAAPAAIHPQWTQNVTNGIWFND